jgi:hypothetical protein
MKPTCPQLKGLLHEVLAEFGFLIAKDGGISEAIYVRPTNGRAGDQFRRNRLIQYISYPDYFGTGCGPKRWVSSKLMWISSPANGSI